MSESQSDEFFDGFRWAVPTAFGDALAKCRFEQGDVLYDTRRAYEDTWGEALPRIEHSIQVISPLRGSAAEGEASEKSRFAVNWNSSVAFTLGCRGEDEERRVVTTQGRLYSLLWKGDLTIIDTDSPSPAVPRLAMQILPDLPRATDRLKETVLKEFKGCALFLMPYDGTQKLLRAKLWRVEAALARFGAKPEFPSPAQAGLDPKREFAPTVSIACFCSHGVSEEAVEEALKQVLYKPAKDKKTSTTRFRVTAHGFLTTI